MSTILENLLDVATQAECLPHSKQCQQAVKDAESFLASIKNATKPASGVLLVEIPERDWTPQDAAIYVSSLKLSGPHVVLISGRGPVWLYCMLTHAAHATKAVATLDPRLGGYVIVESHCAEYVTGKIFNQS